ARRQCTQPTKGCSPAEAGAAFKQTHTPRNTRTAASFFMIVVLLLLSAGPGVVPHHPALGTQGFLTAASPADRNLGFRQTGGRAARRGVQRRTNRRRPSTRQF